MELFRPGDFAGINVDLNAVEMSIPLVDSLVKIQDFDVNASSNLSTSDQANDQVSAGATGKYDIGFNVAAISTGNNKTFGFQVIGVALSGASITAATQATPVVVTASGHGLVNGNLVEIEGVVGMTELNNRVFTVAGVSGDDFSLQDDEGVNINGTGFTAYSSGGTAFLAQEALLTRHRFSTGGDIANLGAQNAASLILGDKLALYVKNATDATNITIGSANLTIRRLG